MANQWFKFYGAEYLSDPKMDRLTVVERSCWLTLLCIASQTNGIVKFLSVEGLLTKSGVKFNPYDTTEWDNAQNVIKNFEMYEMVNVRKNGEIEIKNWEKRQDTALTGYERVKKYRENKARKENANEKITGDNGIDNMRIEENRIEENRIDISNSNSVAIAPLTHKSKFKKPTVEEVENYIKEKNIEVDSFKFWNFYESKGWKVGNNPMQNWKACIATWNKDNNKKIKNIIKL